MAMPTSTGEGFAFPSQNSTNQRDVTLVGRADGRLTLGFTDETTAGNPNAWFTVDEGSFSVNVPFASNAAIDEQHVSIASFRNGVFRAMAWSEKDDATGNFDIY